MPTTLQFRRGTTTQNNAFTGSAGELSIDEQLDVIRVHDGSTAGGAMELTGNTASQTLTNKTLTSPQINTQIDMLARAEMRFQDASGGQYVALEAPATVSSSLTFTLPDADGTSGQAIVTDGSGALSFAAAGATISSDTSTNTDFLIYFASTTSGALTAVKQDSGLIYNPSSGLLTSAAFAGALTGNVTGNASGSSGSCTGNSATATTATTATNVTVADESSDTSCNVLFTTAATGDLPPKSGTNLTFNSSSGQLDATTFSGVATSAKYADLAEKYDSDADYEAGTVLIFGGEKEVTECTAKFDKRIAGIVSTDPAYLMNSDSTGVIVGLIGRVPCKVIGEIRKGDLMVASDTPGHAEAWKEESNPMTGSVIGKAIEDKYGASTGVIEVVVGKI